MESRAVAKRSDRLVRTWSRGTIAVMIAIALLLASCASEGAQQGSEGGDAQAGEEAGQTRPAERVTIEELTDDPSEFYGESVTVSGEVVEAVEPGAFRIEGDDEELLVVGVQQLPRIAEGDVKEVNEGDRVRVTGQVREFKIEEVQQDVDRGIDDEYFGDFEGDPAVLASSVEVMS